MQNTIPLPQFIRGLPKTELHLHIEGTLEPEMLFTLAKRHHISLKYSSLEELKKAYSFSGLQEFLDLYYEGTNVLREEQDFCELTRAYLEKLKEQGVVHTEIFFDPQIHTSRGVPFSTVIGGISRALREGREQLGISNRLIMCFLRHLDETSAFQTLEEALGYRDLIAAVGLDSSERGNPPSKFRRVFARAREEGLLTVAHAGEEGPAAYIAEALDQLQVIRIDHGVAAIYDEQLAAELARRQIPLTVCPLSNLALRVVDNLEDHPLKKLMDKGLLVTVNSDDPAYFGGYINENYQAVAEALQLSRADLCRLAGNSVVASLLSDPEKNHYLQSVDRYYRENR
ncbi:MAG: adenosine deaminase [Mangrovibacterium sp.]